jgi:hypothetical protein
MIAGSVTLSSEKAGGADCQIFIEGDPAQRLPIVRKILGDGMIESFTSNVIVLIKGDAFAWTECSTPDDTYATVLNATVSATEVAVK